MSDLIEYFKLKDVQNKKEGLWKVKFEFDEVVATCKLERAREDTVCVDFTRKSGCQLAFFKIYKDIAAHLTLHNDQTYTV